MTVKSEPTTKFSPPSITTCLLYIGACWAALVILGRPALRSEYTALFSSLPGQGAAILVAALLGLWLITFNKAIHQTLTSIRFGVAMLLSILAATMAGTVILQAPREEFISQYGAISKLLLVFGLNDIFHTVWFGGFLVLLAAALLMVAVKKKMWKLPKWGYLLSHLGVVVIIAGGFLGFFFGFKGQMDLHKGVPQAMATALKTGAERRLGFSVLLEGFGIERYEPEYRFYVYGREGDAYKVSRSLGLDEVGKWTRLSRDYSFRLKKAYPDFYMKSVLGEAAPGAGHPALSLDLSGPDGGERVTLFAGMPERGQALVQRGGPLVTFVWETPSEQDLARRAGQTREFHSLTIEKNGAPEEITVQPGGEYSSRDGEVNIRVQGYIPDFIYDVKNKKPESRSPNPNNPALQVAVSTNGGEYEERWLFAKMPDFGAGHGQGGTEVKLVYHYTPSQAAAAREIVIAGKNRELLALANGVLEKREPLGPEDKGIPEIGAAGYRIMASAGEVRENGTRSDQWNNPAAEIELRHGGEIESVLLPANHSDPLRLPDGRTVMAFEQKPDDVKAYRSRLAVVAGGKTVREKTIAVNDPLSYAGYTFYQSSYRKEDPDYSGVLVVKDPGLSLVLAGFVMICAGVIFGFYVRPRIMAGRVKNAG